MILRSSLFSSGSESPPASPVSTRARTRRSSRRQPAPERWKLRFAAVAAAHALYGIGEAGLPDSASDERKAQAEQLKAYLYSSISCVPTSSRSSRTCRICCPFSPSADLFQPGRR